MKKYLLIIALIISSLSLKAAVDTSFENGLPTDWQSAIGTLSISDYHYKDGTKSLQWDWQSGDVLTASDIQSQGLVPSQVEGYYDNTFYMWVYNTTKSETDSVVISFLDNNNVVQYYFHFYLNYEGWRPVPISYLKEMFGIKESQNLTKMTVTAPSSGNGTLFFDYIDWTGERINRSAPSTHLPYKPNWDENHWSDMYRYSLLPKSYEGIQPTAEELADLAILKSYVKSYIKGTAPTSSNISSADAMYNTLAITDNPDGTLKGYALEGMNGPTNRKIEFINDNILHYARDFAHNGSQTSRDKFMRIIRHVHDQGYHDGCIMESMHHVGYQFRKYPLAVFLMEDELREEGLWEDAYAMVAWFVALDGIWDESAETSNMDAGNTRTLARYLTIFYKETEAEQVQYLKGFRDYVQTWATPHARHYEGIKTDYTGFHHNFYYPARYVNPAYKSISWSVNKLAGTVFEVNDEAKDVLKKTMLVSRLVSNGSDMPMSLAGRGNPFTNLNSAVDGMRDIATTYTPTDKQLAEAINLIEPSNPISGFGKEEYPNGFWQLNYATMGVYRDGTWVADVRGFNNNFMGQEIYAGTSQYARYSSYGAIEVLYSGGNSASGRNVNGWNWNATPGATTIFLPWENLNADGREDEKTDSKLAGALRFGTKENYYLEDESHMEGNVGLFAMDFQQKDLSPNHNTSFKFKKSVFCVDGKMICLGSGINNNDSQNMTATTLFQNYISSTSKTVTVNGTSKSTFPLDESYDTSNDSLWLINAVGTGYYIPKSNGTIQVYKKNQISPKENGTDGTTTGNYALAYIDHGTAPVNSAYEFVIIPQATSDDMSEFSATAEEQYSTIQNNTRAHAVKYGLYEAYALFLSNTNIENSVIKSNSSTCLAIAKKNKNGTLSVSVNNPIITFGADGLATSNNVTISIRGDWSLDESSTGVSLDDANDTLTVITLTLKNGDPQDFTLTPNTVIATEEISISPSEIELTAGESVILVETILPENATNKQATWSSDNTDVATVDSEGNVETISAGTATITAFTHTEEQSATCVITVIKATDLNYTETLENITYTGWGSQTYIGDNGFQWSASGKGVSNYMSATTELYAKNSTIISSSAIPNGISSFSVDCMNKWNDGAACTIDLLVNNNIVGSSSNTSQDEIYKFEVSGINISGDVNIALSVGAYTIVVDNLSWSTYLNTSIDCDEQCTTSKFNIFPNPFTSELNIQVSNDITKVSIIDINGRLIVSKQVNGETLVNLNIADNQLSSGLYFVKLESKTNTRFAKIIKQ